MKTKMTRLLSLLLATLLLTSTLAACADVKDPNDPAETTGKVSETEAETQDPAQAVLDEIGKIDFGGKEFGILYRAGSKSEVFAEKLGANADENSSDTVINEAVYQRNELFQKNYNLVLSLIEKDDAGAQSSAQTEASASTGDFFLINHSLRTQAAMATGGYLRNLMDMDMELDYEWWDPGTASFVLEDGVYFMSGSLNISDDNVTYVLIFNKELQKTYSNTIPSPYETVKNQEWTLDYFNRVIQGISSDNGDGVWDELDTYGFITTWEYGNTFFLGSDLRYVINEDDMSLYLANQANMEKAHNVLQLARSIYHDNNASFMSPPGQEGKGLTAFQENRGMFYGEVAAYLSSLNRNMDTAFGVVPIPKYDKAQENYRTWTHDSGSTFSATAAVPNDSAATIGALFQIYAVLSHQYLKPAYYDTMLTTRNVHDAESSQMLDIIFHNRVYDMAFYFDLGFYDLFKNSVNENNDKFNSSYSSQTKRFEARMKSILKKLQQKN